MKRPFFLLLGLLLIQTVGLAQGARGKIDFNAGWRFKLNTGEGWQSPLKNDENWRVLDLPHDWSIEGSFSKDHPATPGGGALPGGVGWYRKSFSLPTTVRGRNVFIDFEGVYQNSEVWINGHYLGKRPNGYISFRYNLTPFLKFGTSKNLIAVRVDNSMQPNSRWYSGSGIYRNVWMAITSKVYIPLNGVFISTPVVSDSMAVAAVKTTVSNRTEQNQSVSVVTRIYNSDGTVVASQSSSSRKMGAGTTSEVIEKLNIKHPRLWSVSQPVLYKSVTELVVAGKILDQYETFFGIRNFYFDAEKGFFLNGQHVQIRGVCNHHDLGALGAAFNKRAAERQLQLLKNMGCNAIRTSHNPPAPELLDLCDTLGFIVMDEAFDMWKKQKNPFDYHLDWDKWHKKDLEDFVKRDRNHPSVFIWSVGNEIPEQWGDENKGDTTGRVIARELASIVRRLDPTREVTSANNEVKPDNNLIRSGAFDLIGYNYNHREWSKFPRLWPNKKLIVTESVSALATRGHYDLIPFDSIRRWPEAWDKPIKGGGNPDFSVSAYDHVSTPWGATHEESLIELNRNPHVAGMFVWTGFDYLGEPTPYPWPARSSYFGILDLAGFPKDAYYLYQSVWSDEPVLHIYPHWNWHTGDTVDVVAYYNKADEVELFLNGKSLGVKRKQGEQLHVRWRVPFVPGTLKAVSRRNGKDVLRQEIQTSGVPAKIALIPDREYIKADGKDLCFVSVKITDAAGNLVPGADNAINFNVVGNGSLKAVDNGSPVSHELFKASHRKAFNGLALAVIQSSAQAGAIRIEASSPGLPTVAITIKAK